MTAICLLLLPFLDVNPLVVEMLHRITPDSYNLLLEAGCSVVLVVPFSLL
uniref:Uncharacterized protein n=1 Tax=Rhizophora mucronata TaxID=61149 RepID=A0A2P2NWQ3_RHIMU